MKKNILIISIFFAIISFVSCKKSFDNKEIINDSVVGNVNESELLLNFLVKSGEVINNPDFPFLIPATTVFNEKAKCKIIDIRKKDDYVAGHIDGAVNVKFEDLYNYCTDSINASTYDKIIITCYSGQNGSYAASLLRIIGFGNVFALKYGMSSWNKEFANNWINATSSKYSAKLEKTGTPKNAKSEFPIINTGEKSGFEIAKARVKQLFAEGTKNVFIDFDSLSQNIDNFYLISYLDTITYNQGHLPNSCQYTPKKDFSANENLATIPTNKTSVIYCHSGQTGAFAVAYLRVLGYDVKNLKFGANSFMFDLMKSNSIIGKYFDASAYIFDYPFIDGELPSLDTPNQEVETATSNTPQVTVPVKKKEKGSGGGC